MKLASPPQCCQLLVDFSGQIGRKIWPLRKKFGPLVNFPFRRHFAFRNKTIFVYVSRKSTIVLRLAYNDNREKKSRKTNFPEVRPLVGPFCTKSAKIRPQIWGPAALLFIQPLLSYAAEYLASCQHCPPPTHHLFVYKTVSNKRFCVTQGRA
jgi:hypothetical protein